ncbi:MAG: Calx-beta domain-containing protein [Verrucomicrobiia bacterium]
MNTLRGCIGFLLLCGIILHPAFATDTNAPADFTIGTYVVAPSPERFGVNLREPFDYNNYTFDPGFEPVTIRRQAIATGGGTNYIENVSGATMSNWRQIADGFFDGATVRVYRPSSNGGALQLVRSNTVVNYVTDGFRRLHVLPVVTNTFTDTTATPGVNYEYQVRAVNSSAAVSTNYSGGASTAAIATVAALAGSTSASNPTWTNSFYNRGGTAPAIPSNVTATPLSGAVRLDWTANAETDLAGYYIYRRAQGTAQNRIILDNDGPASQAGDVYFVEATYVNPPTHRMHDRLDQNTLNDQWTFLAGSSWPYGRPGSITRDNSTVCPENGGGSSLRLDNPGSHEVRIQQAAFSNPQFHGGYYPALTPGVTYRAEMWMKQSGVPGGTVRFSLTAPYNSISNTFTVGSDWQKFSYLFTAPAMGADGTISSIMLAFNGPGTVWVDNLLLYEDADGNPATYPPFALRPAAAQALADYHPGPIRMNTGVSTSRWGVSMDDFLTEEPQIAPQWGGDGGRVRPDDPYKLPMVLRMTRDVGGEPWIIVGTFMDEQEWLHLMEYLAAPYVPGTDTPATKPYAYLRYSQGQQTPWTDVFPRLFIEFGNEQWNPMFENTFASGNTCGQFSEYFFNVAKTSPWYATVASKLNLIVNGWHISTNQTNGYGHAASLASPGSQLNDIANYIGGWEAGIAVGGNSVNDAGYQGYMMYLPTYIRAFVDQHAVSRAANAAAGHPYKIAVYEGGPGYANPSPGQPYEPVSEVYGKSLAAGVSTLDTYLYNSLKQIDPQCYFTFGGAYNWASHSLVANGYYPHTSWLALQMRNRYASGAMVATAINSAPTLDVDAWTNRTGAVVVSAMPNVPLVQPYAFRSDSNYSVFVLSRRINGDTPVTLRLPFNAVTNATLYTLTGDPRIGNSSNYNINITTQAVTSFSQNYSFTIPPGSAYLFTFAGATTVSAPTQPTVSISRAPGQTGSTTTPAAQFIVNFSEPVAGFTAGDVVIGGTAGATTATVTDTGTTAGMTFTVTVTGMTSSGSVTIQLAAGAVNSVATGLASLASSATDSGVTYSIPPPMNQVFVYDDFNIATNATPVPPFLNGVVTGTNWTGAWVVQGFNGGTNYTDGFKVIATNALAYSTLRTAGNYAGGGGTNYATAGRFLDLGAFSSWAFSKNGTNVIGLTGTELWMSALMRKNSLDDNMAAVILHNGTAAYNAIGNSRLGVGYYGTMSNNAGERYWSLAVRNAADSSIEVIRSDVPIVAGQTVLLVLRMRFGTTDTFDLFVNPSSLGGDAPASPNATKTTTGAADIFFRALAFSGNNALNSMALDEIRFGDTYAAVTPPNAAGTVQFSASGFTINEDGGSATIYVTRTGGVTGAATVDYATSNGTATAGTDYTATTGTLTWADGDGSTKSFAVPILNGGAYEADETINLALSNATSASVGNPSTATLTISSVITATPTSVALLAASDTGASNSDRLTNLDNSAPGKALTFRVSGTVNSATVTLYDGATAIGSASTAGTQTDVTTDGVTTLVNGLHSITAMQTASGKLASAASPAVSVTIDTVSLVLLSAVSRKTHGATNTFELNLSLNPASPTVEPRSGGPTQLFFTFNKAITAADGVFSANEFTLTNATYSGFSITTSNLTLNLSSIPDQSKVTVALNGISDLAGNGLTGASAVRIRSLYGDINQSGTVNAVDLQLLKNNLLQSLSAANFLCDINLSSTINAVDLQQVKNNLLHTVSATGLVISGLSMTPAPPAAALGEALGAPSLTWSTDGDNVWTPAIAPDGSSAAWSGSIGNLNVSWVETIVSGPGTISFDWKVSSELNSDYLMFSVDGADQSGISGEVNWQQLSFTIPSGAHRLTWTYAKNRAVAAGLDTGWLRRILYQSSP